MHLRYALRWTGQFGRAAAIAEVMASLTNNGDAKLYYARKLLRINENECAEAHTPAQHNIP